MTLHPVLLSQEAAAGQEDAQQTAYDSIWAQSEVPSQTASGFERTMLAEDKLFVVLAVVLIIWMGLAFFLLRTDRKLDRMERTLQDRIPEGPEL